MEIIILSDSKVLQNVPSPKQREGLYYPDSTKQDACKLWLVTGNLKQVSTSMNIPYDTIKTWRWSRWWDELSQEIRTEGHLQLSAKMQKLADKAMEVTLNRLEVGEPVLNQKTGEVILKPVSMRDAHQVAVSFQDRALKLQNAPVHEAAQQQVSDRLEALASAFMKMANKTRKIEVIDAIPNEREEGLQAGSPMGEDPETFEAQGPSAEDSSPPSG